MTIPFTDFNLQSRQDFSKKKISKGHNSCENVGGVLVFRISHYLIKLYIGTKFSQKYPEGFQSYWGTKIYKRAYFYKQNLGGVTAAPCGDWKTLSVNPAENGYLFRIREG